MMLEYMENEWIDKELSDAELENISGGTSGSNYFLPIIAGQENSVVNNGPNIGKATTGFATVSQLTGVVGVTGEVFDLTLTGVIINPATP